MRFRGFFLSLACLLLVGLGAGTGRGQCSDNELTAAFVLDNICPQSALMEIETVDIVPVGEVTNPSDAAMQAAVQALQPGSYLQQSGAGPFYHYWDSPSDYGACALVDGRDGRVVFAGTVIWSGSGVVNLPLASSHDWSFPGGDPAAAPEAIAYLDNPEWADDPPLCAQTEATVAALDLLRQTDVLQGFAACGPYTVVSYIFTPVVGLTDPYAAKLVILVSGTCEAPWNGQPVPVDDTTWSGLKALYH